MYFQKETKENDGKDDFETIKHGTHKFLQRKGLSDTLQKIKRVMDGKMPEELWKTLLATASSHAKFKGQEETFRTAFNDLLEIDFQYWKPDEHKPREMLITDIGFALHRRVFFRTESGYGISETGIKKGDQLVLLFPPVYCPFIVRRLHPEGDEYQLVSVAYIPPKLQEQAEKAKSTEFKLV